MPTSFLTREGYEKLQEELDHLRTHKRQEIANRLHEAMEVVSSSKTPNTKLPRTSRLS